MERFIDLDNPSDASDDNSTSSITNHDTHLFELESRNKLSRVAHLNTQSMTSTFDDF